MAPMDANLVKVSTAIGSPVTSGRRPTITVCALTAAALALAVYGLWSDRSSPVTKIAAAVAAGAGRPAARLRRADRAWRASLRDHHLRVDGGFLRGLDLHFTPGVNVLIGLVVWADIDHRAHSILLGRLRIEQPPMVTFTG